MTKILFVCLGNICRSPMAKFIFQDILRKKGFESDFFIDSAATSKEEVGNELYYNAKMKLDEKNVSNSNHIAKQITKNDYEKFDYIIGMEKRNIENILKIIGEDSQNKVYRLLDFSNNPRDIADPWYTRDFERTYLEIVEGCEGLLKHIIK